MEKSVLTAIERFSLLENTSEVTVALSGGADSMSLLYVLNSIKEHFGITLYAAHLNHMIRGDEALRDEEFVKRACECLNIPLFCERIDVPSYAKQKRISTELAAREVRYEFLARVSKGLVATAHTASDNLETVLFNLTRGSALKGLCGIPPKRGIFIRPLILCTRDEVESYCEKNGIEYVTDSTNLSDEYTRNKIRHNVIPVLKQINFSAEKAAVRTAAELAEDNAFLEECADKYLSDNVSGGGLDISDLPSAPIAKRAIKKFTEMSAPELSLDNLHILEIYRICKEGGRTGLSSGFSAEIKDSRLFITNNNTENCAKIEFKVETERRINDLFTKDEKINNLLLKNSLDCDKIIGKSVLRTRLAGDSIRLAGRGCTKPLKKLMNELAVPKELRGSIPVIADEAGVIWVYGIGVAQRCAVTKNSDEIMIIKVSERKI
ncbi:MAG: tRNA lysidine(34) synthetase TilS [Acutalibacteraceae bacterium]